MKRKLPTEIYNITKRTKPETIPFGYHSASSVHNYMLNDPILDYLKYNNYKKNRTTTTTTTTTTSSISGGNFFDFITQQGKKFEESIIGRIQDILHKKDITFLHVARTPGDIKLVSKYEETLDAIKNNIGVIYQGVLHGNDTYRAFGSPDLLIRGDIVNSIIQEPIDKVPKKYYVVVDIKYTTLKLRADGKYLLNSGRMPANKGQIMIYNHLLGIAQGYLPRYCYVLGRGWKYTKKDETFIGHRFDERLGVIDTKGVDEKYSIKIEKALKWLDNVKENAIKWDLNPPSVPELYPNMCNRYDNGDYKKKEIAKEIEEITQMWNCGPKQRELAHQKGVYKLSDPRLTSEIMGFPQDTPRTKLIDKMLKFNQGLLESEELVIPRFIDNNPYDWQNESPIEFYLDFETLPIGIFDDFSPEDIQDEIVFMIGLGVSCRAPFPGPREKSKKNRKPKWKYYNFSVPALTDDYEYKMFDELYKKIEEYSNEYGVDIEDANIYHWGHIEQTVLKRFQKKYYSRWPLGRKNLNLVDFCRIFQDEGILVKGVYGFSLKSIGKELLKQGLIEGINAWEGNISDGLDAMVQAYIVYNNEDRENSEIIKDIIKYNHTDVRMIEKIINYLREYHTPLFFGNIP